MEKLNGKDFETTTWAELRESGKRYVFTVDFGSCNGAVYAEDLEDVRRIVDEYYKSAEWDTADLWINLYRIPTAWEEENRPYDDYCVDYWPASVLDDPDEVEVIQVKADDLPANTLSRAYYVIGGQYQVYCYGGTDSIHAAKILATKHAEYWDNWAGWHRPDIYAAENLDLYPDGKIVPQYGATPILSWDRDEKKWI